MKIYITGISGTGKTSLARALIARGDNAIDIDEISHWENKDTKERVGLEPGASEEWHASHAWICDLVKLKEILLKTENAVALGHASNQAEYLTFFDKIFVLRCSPETVVNRINSRTDNDFGKHPDDLARIMNWQKPFEAEMISKGAEILDAERPLDEILSEVVSNFHNHD